MGGITVQAKLNNCYALALPSENIVLFKEYDLNGPPQEFFGTLGHFLSNKEYGSNVVFLDWHIAYCLEWLDARRMVKNMPYLDDKIRAAIALVT